MRTTVVASLLLVMFRAERAQTQFEGQFAWIGGSTDKGQAAVYAAAVGVTSGSNQPGTRDSAMRARSATSLYLFGGFVSSSGTALMNDLWRMDIPLQSWVFLGGSKTTGARGLYGTKGVATDATQPGARAGGITWVSSAGDLWLFGGSGYGAQYFGTLNDVWSFNTSSLRWTWLSGSSDVDVNLNDASRDDLEIQPGGRSRSAHWLDAGGRLWCFGGIGPGNVYMNDMWLFDPHALAWQRVDVQSRNLPAARAGAACFTHRPSGQLFLFGGGNPLGGSNSQHNDLWSFDIASRSWRMLHSDAPGGAFSGQNVMASTNRPSARESAAVDTDGLGHGYLFGGRGPSNLDSSGTYYLADLWFFNASFGSDAGGGWAWIAGSLAGQQAALYPSPKSGFSFSSRPSSRTAAILWIDPVALGSAYVYGGSGFGWDGTDGGNVYSFGQLSDLWHYAAPAATYGAASPGLVGYYWNSMAPSGPYSAVVSEGPIDFNWETGPGPTVLGGRATLFFVRWVGFVRPPLTTANNGTYSLCAGSDDGVRLRVSNVRIINRWEDRSYSEDCATVVLPRGVWTPVSLDFYQNLVQARVTLSWQGPGTGGRDIVPLSALSSGVWTGPVTNRTGTTGTTGTSSTGTTSTGTTSTGTTSTGTTSTGTTGTTSTGTTSTGTTSTGTTSTGTTSTGTTSTGTTSTGTTSTGTTSTGTTSTGTTSTGTTSTGTSSTGTTSTGTTSTGTTSTGTTSTGTTSTGTTSTGTTSTGTTSTGTTSTGTTGSTGSTSTGTSGTTGTTSTGTTGTSGTSGTTGTTSTGQLVFPSGAPLFVPVPDQSCSVGSVLTVAVIALDLSGEPVRLTAILLPESAVLAPTDGASSGQASFTMNCSAAAIPFGASAAVAEVRIAASNDFASSLLLFSVRVALCPAGTVACRDRTCRRSSTECRERCPAIKPFMLVSTDACYSNADDVQAALVSAAAASSASPPPQLVRFTADPRSAWTVPVWNDSGVAVGSLSIPVALVTPDHLVDVTCGCVQRPARKRSVPAAGSWPVLSTVVQLSVFNESEVFGPLSLSLQSSQPTPAPVFCIASWNDTADEWQCVAGSPLVSSGTLSAVLPYFSGTRYWALVYERPPTTNARPTSGSGLDRTSSTSSSPPVPSPSGTANIAGVAGSSGFTTADSLPHSTAFPTGAGIVTGGRTTSGIPLATATAPTATAGLPGMSTGVAAAVSGTSGQSAGVGSGTPLGATSAQRVYPPSPLAGSRQLGDSAASGSSLGTSPQQQGSNSTLIYFGIGFAVAFAVVFTVFVVVLRRVLLLRAQQRSVRPESARDLQHEDTTHSTQTARSIASDGSIGSVKFEVRTAAAKAASHHELVRAAAHRSSVMAGTGSRELLTATIVIQRWWRDCLARAAAARRLNAQLAGGVSRQRLENAAGNLISKRQARRASDASDAGLQPAPTRGTKARSLRPNARRAFDMLSVPDGLRTTEQRAHDLLGPDLVSPVAPFASARGHDSSDRLRSNAVRTFELIGVPEVRLPPTLLTPTAASRGSLSDEQRTGPQTERC